MDDCILWAKGASIHMSVKILTRTNHGREKELQRKAIEGRFRM
jgi:hypothetical protein